jgi:hypothetical protein
MLRNKVQQDGSKSAARTIVWTIGGGIGLSLAVRTLTGSSPLEHPVIEVSRNPSEHLDDWMGVRRSFHLNSVQYT